MIIISPKCNGCKHILSVYYMKIYLHFIFTSEIFVMTEKD
jgi:hypothetical protein